MPRIVGRAIAVIAVGAALLAASAPDADATLVGVINPQVYVTFSTLLPDSTLSVQSQGGEAKSSIALARLIIDRRIRIRLNNYCLSACAELVLPAARDVTAVNEPLIGLHGNAFTDERAALAARMTPSSLACLIELRRGFESVYESKGIDGASLRDAEVSRLGFTGMTLSSRKDAAGCPIFSVGHSQDYWFPTRRQIEKLMRTEVVGPICADSEECMRRKVREHWGVPGTSFDYVWGDARYRLTVNASNEASWQKL